MNPKVGVVYVFDEVTGKYFELGEAIYLSSDDFLDGYDRSKVSTTMSVTLTLYIQPKDKLKLLGITNNSIRLHGGKAIRTIPKRFWK